MALISPFFPLAHGVPRVDDRRVVSGIVYVPQRLAMEGRAQGLRPAQNALQSLHPLEPARGVRPHFGRSPAHGPRPERIMIHSTHLKAHRTAASL